GCVFSDNSTSSDGGAIENLATVIVTQTMFTNNHSTRTDAEGGGAIGNFGTLTVNGDSSFTGNTATTYGGAIYNAGTATVSQTSFGDGSTAARNSASYGGAIMNSYGAYLTANSNTSFNGNSATYGGAIFSSSTLIANGVTFANNTAYSGGGMVT